MNEDKKEEDEKGEARIFRVTTSFQKSAQKPGGVSRELAIAGANRQVEQIKPELIGWMMEQLDGLPVAVAEAETSPLDPEKQEEVERIARSLREIGTTLGFGLLTIVAGNLCEIFTAFQHGAPYRKDIVDCHIAALLLSTREEYRMMDPDELPELKLGLRQVLAISHRGAKKVS